MFSHRWARLAALAILFLCPPFTSHASTEKEPTQAPSSERSAPEDPLEGEEPIVLDPVEVIGEREPVEDRLPTQDRTPTGFGTTLLRDRFPGERIDTSDLLLQAPGVTVRRNAAGSTFSIRGASPDQTLVLLDGIRLSPAAGGGLDLRTIPVELLEDVTILRGNEGARYGAGALGGVALLRTRRVGGPARLQLSAGSFGTWSFHGIGSADSPGLHGLAALSLDRTAGDYPADFDPTPSAGSSVLRRERVSNNDSLHGALLLKGGVRVEDLRIHGLAQGSLGERGLPGTLYFRDTQRHAEQHFVAAVGAEPWSPRDVSLSGALTYRRDAHKVWGAGAPSVISQPHLPDDSDPWQVEQAVEATASVELAPAAFTLVRIDASAGGEWLRSPYHGTPERERFSLALSDELFLGASVLLAPAVRYDRIGDFDGLSPKLGLSVRPLGFLEIRGNVGASFRAPSLSELYLSLGPTRPNPDLRPERGGMVDGGLIFRSDRLTAQVSAFYGRTSDLISYEIVSGGTNKPFNFMDAEVVGGEAEATFRLLPWLSLSGGYGLARTRNLLDDPRFTGKELPYRPSQRLSSRISAGTEAWEGFAEGHHQSKQWVNRSNSAFLPGQTWFRLGAGRRLTTAPWEIWASAQADNLLDATLVDQLGFPKPGRAFFFTLRASPGARDT